MLNTLVIGYGNTLRRDDGAGYHVAETIAGWHLEGVTVRTCHQLMPELAEEIAQAQRVIFIDAIPWTGTHPPVVAVRELQPDESPRLLSHRSTPEGVLGLGRSLYQANPQAYWVLIPGIDFELGEGFSEMTANQIAVALGQIQCLLGDRVSPGGIVENP